jgi:hypothetical protein
VYLTREQAIAAWGTRVGGSLEVCDASVYNVTGDGDAVTGFCLVQNVALGLTGATYDVTRAVFGRAAARINSTAAPAPSATSTASFHGAPSSIVVQPGEVGSGWTIAETQQEGVNQYSSGKLFVALRQGGSTAPSGVLAVTVEVFRDAPTAVAAWKQDTAGFVGGPVSGCDDGWLWILGDSARLSCRQANVEITVGGASAEVLKAALAPMLRRVSAGLT